MRILEIFTGIYGFSIGTGGLAYIGLGVGFFVATLFGAYFADGIYARVRPGLAVGRNRASDTMRVFTAGGKERR